MDNIPKEDNQAMSSQAAGGEIFSQKESSAYSDAVNAPVEGDASPPYTSEVGSPGVAASSGNPPAESAFVPPPPFAADNRKKLIVVLLLFIVISLVGYLLMNVFRSRVGKTVIETANISLTYWGLWEEEEIIRPLIDEYKKSHENVTINYIRQDHKQYRERLQAAIERGEGPDIFRFHNTWLPMLINNTSPMPKTIYSDEEFEKTFYPAAKNDLLFNGNYFGIPLEIDGLLLFYNEDILKGANVAIPTTWVDVQDAVGKLTVKENDRIVTSAIALGTAENIEHFSDILGLMMLQNGTVLSKSLFDCTDPTSNTCAVETLTFYGKFAETPNNSWDGTLDNSILAFAGGKVAMILAPSWEALTIKAISPNLNFKTAPVPQLPCDRTPCPSVNWASYWVEGVSAKSKNTKESWDFLKYLSAADTMQKKYAEEIKVRKLFGEPYSRVDLGKSLSDNQYLASLITQAPTMKSFYLVTRTFDGETGINSSLINYLKDAVNSLSEGGSPETALKTADEGFKQVYSRFGLSQVSPAQ